MNSVLIVYNMSDLIVISDIQEFYELTLLDESKTVQQKTAETLLIASKWEHENSIKSSEVRVRDLIFFRVEIITLFILDKWFHFASDSSVHEPHRTPAGSKRQSGKENLLVTLANSIQGDESI